MSKSNTHMGINYQKRFLFYYGLNKMKEIGIFKWSFKVDDDGKEADFSIQNHRYESKTDVTESVEKWTQGNSPPAVVNKAISQLFSKFENTNDELFIITNHHIKFKDMDEFYSPGKQYDLVNSFNFDRKHIKDTKNVTIPKEFISKIKLLSWPVKNGENIKELDALLRKEADMDYFDETFDLKKEDIMFMSTNFDEIINRKIKNGNDVDFRLFGYHSKMSSIDWELFEQYDFDEIENLIILIEKRLLFEPNLDTFKTNKVWKKYLWIIEKYENKIKSNKKIIKILERKIW